jgi:large subunit ribosomal protein L9
MKIILLKDASRVGRKYEMKEVADGFAINSLIPRGVAVPATPSYIKMVEEKKKQNSILKEEYQKAFEYALTKLPGGKLHIAGKANEKGSLFAGITKSQLIDEFKKETGVELASDHFELEKSIKETGDHTIEVKIDDQKYKLVVNIKGE